VTTQQTQTPSVIIQSWVKPELAEQLKAQSDLERRAGIRCDFGSQAEGKRKKP
jgi:hypothetical protein